MTKIKIKTTHPLFITTLAVNIFTLSSIAFWFLADSALGRFNLETDGLFVVILGIFIGFGPVLTTALTFVLILTSFILSFFFEEENRPTARLSLLINLAGTVISTWFLFINGTISI